MKKIFLFFLILIILLSVAESCIQFRSSTSELNDFFDQKSLKPKIGYYQSLNRNIRYLSIGNDSTEASILFIHGAPSSMSYFKNYLSDSILLTKAKMYAVDRPGYGYSGFGLPEPSLEKQARIIKVMIDSLQTMKKPVILMGTSYGTSIACRIAMDYPELVDGIILVAPSLAPGEEKIYPISYPIEKPVIKWMVPRMIKSANSEKLNHESELKKMLPYWDKIKVPVIYIQGEKDELIYPSNAEFARKHLKNAVSLEIIFIPERGHIISFTEKPLIQKSILKMINQLNHSKIAKAG